MNLTTAPMTAQYSVLDFERDARGVAKDHANLLQQEGGDFDEMTAICRGWSDVVAELAAEAQQARTDQYREELKLILAADVNEDAKRIALEDARRRHDDDIVQINVIRMQNAPAKFVCECCDELAQSHDERGELIAEFGAWAMQTGRKAAYMVCCECQGSPESREVLSRHFAEWEESDRQAELQLEAIVRVALEVDDVLKEVDDILNGPQPPRGAPSSGNSATPGASGPQAAWQGTGQAAPGAFRFLTFDQVLNLAPKQWLIDRVVGPRDLGMLYGEPSSGKTFLGLDLSVAACLGRKWGGHFDIARPLTVVYCAGEGAAGLRDRYESAALAWGITGLPNLTLVPEAPQLFADPRSRRDTIDHFVDELKRHGVGHLDLLVIDTLHTATVGAEENSSKDMGIVVDRLRAASSALGCAILIVHHTDKAGLNYRGSSALQGAMDVMIKAKSDGGDYTLECNKLKDGAKWGARAYSLIAKGPSAYVLWGAGATPGAPTSGPQRRTNDVKSVLMGSPARWFTARDIVDRTGLKDPAARRALNKLVASGFAEVADRPSGNGPVAMWRFSLPPTP